MRKIAENRNVFTFLELFEPCNINYIKYNIFKYRKRVNKSKKIIFKMATFEKKVKFVQIYSPFLHKHKPYLRNLDYKH